MVIRRKLPILAVTLCLVGLAAGAYGVCNQSSASTADIALWNTHGCWQAFFLWSYQAYNQHQSDWNDRGWNDACNVNLEFPKHWNAAYLVTYGLADLNCCSFHGTIDYRQLGEAAGSAFHNPLHHTCSDDLCCFGSFTPAFWPWDTDDLATHCPLYNATVTNANPASRGGDFQHEGWHGWLNKYGWDNGSCGGHRCGPLGNCTASRAISLVERPESVSSYAMEVKVIASSKALPLAEPGSGRVSLRCFGLPAVVGSGKRPPSRQGRRRHARGDALHQRPGV